MKAFSVSLYGNEPVGAGAEIVIHALWQVAAYHYDGFRAAIKVHLNNKDAAKADLKTYKAARPELKMLQDYEEVAPAIIKDYLRAELKEIWDLVW